MLSLLIYDPNGFLFCVIPQLNAVDADCEAVFFPVVRPKQDLQQHLIAIHRDELFYDVGTEWGYGMLFDKLAYVVLLVSAVPDANAALFVKPDSQRRAHNRKL